LDAPADGITTGPGIVAHRSASEKLPATGEAARTALRRHSVPDGRLNPDMSLAASGMLKGL
jgi:hypothetical protein